MRRLLPVLLLLLPALAWAQDPIPADRKTDWSYAGVPGGIPTYSTICHTFNSTTGTAANINAKIIECGSTYPNGSVVLLQAGTYVWNEWVGLTTSKVVLRGAGADQTIITHATGNARLIGYFGYGGGYTSALDIAITNGAKDGFTFTVASASGLSVGQMIQIDRTDASYVYTAYPGRNHVQYNVITNINGTTITVRNPLVFDFTTGTPKITAQIVNLKSGIGLEDLKLDHSGNTTGQSTTVSLGFCSGCWIKGVEDYAAFSYHIGFNEPVVNFEIRDSFIHAATSYGSNNAGINSLSSHTRIENNIIDKAFPNIEVNSSAAGSVIGYNYILRPQPGETSIYVTYGLSNVHAPHPAYLLYEGNITPMMGSDAYFGSSSHTTFFRNLATGATMGLREVPETGNAIWLKRFSYYYNIVGNVLGSTEAAPSFYETPSGGQPACGGWCQNPYEFGFPNMGNLDLTPYDGWYPTTNGGAYPDAMVNSTLMRWGNYDFYNDAVRWESSEIPAGVDVPGNQTLRSSYYLTSKPSWFGAVAFPPIGPDVTATTHGGVGTSDASGHANKIPAQLCWESRNLLTGGTFNANACYYGAAAAPNAPTNVRIR